MRVLGVDPGLTRCGLGVVDGPAARPRLLAARLVTTPAGLPTEQRLASLHGAVTATIEAYRPDVVVVERVLFSGNARTAMATGQAAGVALLAAAEAGRPVHAYSPTDVKLAVAGHGAAGKDAVARMVAAQLHLGEPPAPADVADALAVAVCHLARAPFAGTAQPTPAAEHLATAVAEAGRARRGGWEAWLGRRAAG